MEKKERTKDITPQTFYGLFIVKLKIINRHPLTIFHVTLFCNSFAGVGTNGIHQLLMSFSPRHFFLTAMLASIQTNNTYNLLNHRKSKAVEPLKTKLDMAVFDSSSDKDTDTEDDDVFDS